MERVKVRPILMAQQVCHKLFVDGAELIETKRDTTNNAAIIWYADGKDDPPRFVVKEFGKMCEEFNMEVEVCRKIQSLKRQKITLNFVKARPLLPLRILMEPMDGTLAEINVENQHLAPLIARMARDLKTMCEEDMYYCDFKLENILYKDAGTELLLKFGDLSSVSCHGEWAVQTFPYPEHYDRENYDETSTRACEPVVAWGLAILWLLLLNHGAYKHIVYEKLHFTTLDSRSLRAFYHAIRNEEIPERLHHALLLNEKRLDHFYN